MRRGPRICLLYTSLKRAQDTAAEVVKTNPQVIGGGTVKKPQAATPSHGPDLAAVERRVAESEGELLAARREYERLQHLHGLVSQSSLTPAERNSMDLGEFYRVPTSCLLYTSRCV